jgi:hypothetical protein
VAVEVLPRTELELVVLVVLVVEALGETAQEAQLGLMEFLELQTPVGVAGAEALALAVSFLEATEVREL